MATKQAQTLAKWALIPSVATLAAWAFIPLALTFYFAFLRYNLQDPDNTGWAGFSNFYYFFKDPFFLKDLINTLLLVVGVIVTTVVGGTFLALLLDQPFWGRGIVRLMVISPFFIMPTVSSLVWKNLIMHPVFGLFAEIQRFFGFAPLDWFGRLPLFSVGMIVAWQWLPYAALILLTALQSLDEEQKDASAMDGANPLNYFRFIVLPHLARPITVVILIETIFILNVFAEIKVTSVGGFAGNLTYLVFSQLNDANDVGMAAAGGLVAVVLANFVSAFLVRLVGRNLEN
ncbi:carbohydrate ABC transporter permease [Devosia sp.]|uniref:carbohydrate ABC transporter permease n=1 Tax=Devosia sp. TaxID=1871048 RepID=UPI003BA9C9F7